MQISKKGLELIKSFEGCRLTAYKDVVGVWTIGYGTTNADKSITGKTLKEGVTIDQKTADEWLEKSVNRKYSSSVMKYDNIYHWNQNQFDALVSFAYNIGSIDQLTAKGTRSIAQISVKILEYNKAGGNVLKGLVRRREAEKKLFDTPVEDNKSTGTPQMNSGKSSSKYSDKDITELARRVYRGEFGNGATRKARLEHLEKGLYAKVQKRVNELYYK